MLINFYGQHNVPKIHHLLAVCACAVSSRGEVNAGIFKAATQILCSALCPSLQGH